MKEAIFKLLMKKKFEKQFLRSFENLAQLVKEVKMPVEVAL
jgi:hypothetical protein